MDRVSESDEVTSSDSSDNSDNETRAIGVSAQIVYRVSSPEP